MFNVLALNKISKFGTDRLCPEKYNIVSEDKNPDGILVRSAEMNEMEFPTNLKAIARAGAGVNNIPVARCSEIGIVVFNTPGANANAVKELVIAALLLSSRKVYQGIKWAQGLTEDVAKQVEKGKGAFVGPEIQGKKLGVIGLGAIGVLVANACNSLGMEVYGLDPFISVDAAWKLSRSIKKAKDISEIVEECDYITIHVPLNKDTKGMFGDELLSKVKPGVRILNFSRGEIVNNDAIKRAIASKAVSCYVTDFPTEELLGIEDIITIPHLAASTPESEDNCAVMAADQLKNFLEFGNIKNSVNFPECEMAYSGRKRIAIIHRNIPNVVGPITSALAGKSLNIDNMINKSQGEYAYTMIDVDQTDLAGVEEELKEINGVIRIRVI